MPSESPDAYRTIAKSAKAEPLKTKGSRFIGEAFPVRTEEEARERLGTVRKREHAATHHCWAYRLGPAGDTFQYSDDGEPHGSAGLSIFRQIEGRELTNVLVVVTRYYGGRKLGTGGLVRAYGEAAGLVLDEAPKREIIVRVPMLLRFAFADTSPAMHTIGKFDAKDAESSYTAEGTELTLNVRRSEVEPMKKAFVEALGGRGDVVEISSDM